MVLIYLTLNAGVLEFPSIRWIFSQHIGIPLAMPKCTRRLMGVTSPRLGSCYVTFKLR
ncbi:uncharacterized protein J3R85_017990 [Psidium guajava]|nr:uncharacterized protein J3R85_017990 [Psidium guajava]